MRARATSRSLLGMGWSKAVGGCAAASLAFTLAACGGVNESRGGDPNAGGAAGASPNIFVDELRGREGCLPRALPVAETTGGGFEAGQTRCGLTQVVVPAPGAACACDASLRLVSTAPIVDREVRRRVKLNQSCDGTTGVSCESLCLCDLLQSAGAALTQCQTDAVTPSAELPPGFCFIDVTLTPPLGNEALVSTCSANSRRELRILGPVLQPDQVMFLSCPGGSLL